MNTRKLGDIDLRDYLRIVRPKQPWKKLRAIAVAGACILCFGAGYAGPWPGRQVKNMTFADALNLLEPAPREEWEHEHGVYVMQEQIRKALGVLAEVAQEEGQPGQDASLALRNLTRNGLAHIQTLATFPGRSDIHQESLQRIEKDLQRR